MYVKGIIGLGIAAGLSACAATPQSAAPAMAAVEMPVDYAGNSYAARVAPGQPGKMLTANGAMAVTGASVTVRPFAGDQGKLAKAVASEACAAQGRSFNPAAIGGYAAGAWVFAGACA